MRHLCPSFPRATAAAKLPAVLRDDLATRGPVRMSLVENEQKAILLIVRRLAESGEIVIGGGEDIYV